MQAYKIRGTKFGISVRFILLSFVLILVGQFLIFIPVLTQYGIEWARDQVQRGHSLVLFLQSRDQRSTMTFNVGQTILQAGGFTNIILHEYEEDDLLRSIIVGRHVQAKYIIDLDKDSNLATGFKIWQLLSIGQDESFVQIKSFSTIGDNAALAIQMPSAILAAELNNYLTRNILLSFVLMVLVALGLFLATHRMLVGPIRRLIFDIEQFQNTPEQYAKLVADDVRTDEIGVLQASFNTMQHHLTRTIRRQRKLALLGEAIARINHDVRSMLSTAHLLAQTLERSDDPKVRKNAPSLMASLDRAAELCSKTLEYVHTPEPMVMHDNIDVNQLIYGLNAHFADRIKITFDNKPQYIKCDEQLLYRVLLNLITNAIEANADHIDINILAGDNLKSRNEIIIIEIIDNGNGIEEQLVEQLFKPFALNARGNGLGLAIANELVSLMGGHLLLHWSNIESDNDHSKGSCFRIEFNSIS